MSRDPLPPKFAREPYAKARERLGLPPHPAKVAWDKRQADRASSAVPPTKLADEKPLAQMQLEEGAVTGADAVSEGAGND